MRRDEPFDPPIRDEAIGQTYWYCYHCSVPFQELSAILAHLRTAHPIVDSPDRGIDYELGSHVLLARLKRREWEEREAERFAKVLNSLRGADDFVLEAELADA